MRCLTRSWVTVVLVTMAATSATAQKNSVTPFRSGIDLVALDVAVTDSAGRLVRGLTPTDFVILEDRVPQHLTLFAADDQTPVAAVVLIDRSASMNGRKLERALEAAAGLIRSLRPGDLVEVMAFNQTAERLFALGPNRSGAESALTGVLARGQTALFEAVLVAVRELQGARRGKASEYREAIIVLSDGEDTRSRLPFEEVLDEVRRGGVIVYGLSLRTDREEKALPPLHEMTQLAYDTGGRAITIYDLATLGRVYTDIATELRQMYRLGYPFAAARDGRWHSLAVRVVASDARTRTRAGYYAPRPNTLGELP